MMTPSYNRAQKVATLIGLFLAWAVGYADRILMTTALVPISHEFALNAREAGMLLSAFSFSYAMTQLVGGWLSDRFGTRIVVVACILMWSVFTGATSIAWSFTSLLVIRFMFGFGEGSFSPASSVTVAQVFPKPERARAKSFLISTVYLGSAAGSGLIVLTVSQMGWRGAFDILSVSGVVVALFLWFALGIGRNRNQPAQDTPERPRVVWRTVLRMPIAWRLVAIWFFTSILHNGVQSWMPSYLLQTYHIDLKHVGMAIVVSNLVAFAGGYGVGELLDRCDRRRERFFLVFGAAMSTLFVVLMLATHTLWLLVVFWTLFLLSFNFVYATVFAAPLRHAPEHLIGSVSGVMNFGGQLGNALTPVAMGAVIVATGRFQYGFWLPLIAGLLSVAASLTWRAPSDIDTPQHRLAESALAG